MTLPYDLHRSTAALLQHHDLLRAAYEQAPDDERPIVVSVAHSLAVPSSVEVDFMRIQNLQKSKIDVYEALGNIAGARNKTEPDDRWVEYAAKTQTIRELGLITIRRALEGYKQQCRNLEREGRSSAALQISVNVHPDSLAHPNCASDVYGIVTELEIEPKQVIIEITEHAPLCGQALRQAFIFHEIGFPQYLDDCDDEGLLAEVVPKLPPLAGVKVSFKRTRNIEKLKHIAQSRVAKVFRLAESLGIERRVAEGTERYLQMAVLQDLGATHAQGFKWPKRRLAETYDELYKNRRKFPQL